MKVGIEMKRSLHFIIIFFTHSLSLLASPGFEGVEYSGDTLRKIADDHIRIALRLNGERKERTALQLLRLGVEKTEFQDVKIRYFLAKQYVLVMKKEATTKKIPEFRTNLRIHYKAVLEYVQGTESTLKEISYYSSGLREIVNSGLLYKNVLHHPLVSYSKLLEATRKARSHWPGVRGKCYQVILLAAQYNGARGDGWSWPDTKKYRWNRISNLKSAIHSGILRPGMVVYANTRPGADPSSLNMRYSPHWFTYLGKDPGGVDRFADQYRTNYTASEMEEFIPGRLIDSFFDPYQRIWSSSG